MPFAPSCPVGKELFDRKNWTDVKVSHDCDLRGPRWGLK